MSTIFLAVSQLSEWIQNTQAMVGYPGYLEKTLASHSPGGRGGSIWSREISVNDVANARWVEFEDQSLQPGCRAFRSDDLGPGVLGVVELLKLDPNQEVRLVDPKKTGTVTPMVFSKDVPISGFGATTESTMIIGQEGGNEVIFTVHPGRPIRASAIEAGSVPADRMTVTAAEATRLGATWAKIVD